jgi:alpha-galactosidase
MPRDVRVSIVGAGSASFSLGLVRDLCLTENFANSTVCLMDIDEERVSMVHRLATRYAEELGVGLRFEKTTDRALALEEADFVSNTASVGAHGGGGFASLHNLRLFRSVAGNMERLCPGGWLLQSGNPVFEGCTLMTRETSTKVVGLCHGHYEFYQMAEVLGLEKQHTSWQAVGFNHVIFLTHFFYKGEDAYPLLDEWIAAKAEDYWRTYRPQYWQNQMSRAAVQQYKMVGLMPIGDTVRAGGWWYHTGPETKRHWFGPLGGFDSEEGWAQYIAELEETRTRMFETAADPSARVTEIFPPEKSDEQIVPIMDALANDVRGHFQVNIPNEGLITGIPDDVVVEVPAVVSERGIQGVRLGRLPDNLMAQVMYPRLAEAERAIALARQPNRGLLLNMVLHRHVGMYNGYWPPVASLEEAEREVNHLLARDPELVELLQS